MYEQVVSLLAWLGYIVKDADKPLINFLLTKTVEYVKATCNISEIPEGLTYKIVERVVGEFLTELRGTNRLEGINFEAIPKVIREGDTQITFAYGEGSYTPEQLFNKLVDFLTNNFERNLSLYRCVRW